MNAFDLRSGVKLALARACIALGCLLLAFSSGSCTSNVEEKLALARLSQDCLVNSDCAAPFVCAFQACHVECESSRDCDDGARCVAASRPYKVCQLEEERTCSRTSDCVEGLVCGVDGECRDSCRADRDCIEDQACASGTCADLDELADGQLEPAAGVTRGQEGSPCVYVSDCSGALLCRGQACLPECRGDADCSEAQSCDETRCVSNGAKTVRCSYNSECDGGRGERCLGGSCLCACVEDRDCSNGQVCNGCGCEAAPAEPNACVYNSDCPAPGELCTNRVCSCACAADVDCGDGMRCDGCGCVPSTDPVDGIVIGNVYIQSSLQLPTYAGVTEIRGDLDITARATVSLGDTFKNLRSIEGRLTIYGCTALEAVDGFPELETAASVRVSYSHNVRTIDLPSLKSAELDFSYLPALTTLSLPRLNSSAIVLYELRQVTQVALPALAETKRFVLDGATSLEQLSLPELTTVSGDFIVGSAALSALSQLSAPKLSWLGAPPGSSFSITNTKLTGLESVAPGAPAVSLSYVNFAGNAWLNRCAIDAFIARCGSGVLSPPNVSDSPSCATTCEQGACVP